MSLSHIIVIVFMLITVAFIVWLEIDSRKNAKQKENVVEGSEAEKRH